MLTQRLGIPTISTGNILREGNPERYGDRSQSEGIHGPGNLVPDDVIIGIVRDRLAQPDCANGIHPRRGAPHDPAGPKALESAGIQIDHVVSIEIDDAVIEARMTGRRVCGACGACYHITAHPPKVEGRLRDACGGHRETATTRRKRCAAAWRYIITETEALKDFYQQLGKLRLVEGNQPIEDANRAILGAIGA